MVHHSNGLNCFLQVLCFLFTCSQTAVAQTSKAAATRPAMRVVSPAAQTAVGNALSITRAKAATTVNGTSATLPSSGVPVGAANGSVAVANEDVDPEIEEIVKRLKTLPEAQRVAMLSYYQDLGITIPSSLLEDSVTNGSGRTRQLLRLIRTVNFVRRPEAVLDARGKIGLVAESLPSEDASDQEILQWFHRHAMAADWNAVRALLVLRAGREAEGLYAALVQGTNHAESELIPEDVLGLSEAAPTELPDWQVDALAGLLKKAAAKTSTQPLIEEFRKGTTWFGTKDETQRDRTVRLLLAADLPIEAYEFMPTLEAARSDGDAAVMKGHAEYQLARSVDASGLEGERLLETAWQLFGEVALLETADANLRTESLGRAVDLLPQVPPGPGLQWLRNLFEHPTLAPVGLQAVALKALKLEDEKLPEANRAQAILTMKEAVDTLLEREGVQGDQLNIPLRMLTIGLLSRAEKAIQEQAAKNGVSEVAILLLRSMPDEEWRKRIEPSLVGRAFNAFIGVALIADETDLALELLEQGIERQPSMSTELATGFLNLWVQRMRARMAQPTTSTTAWMYAYSRRQRPSAPVTRGWQNRNLDRLAEMITLLDGIGVDGRELPGVVSALQACYGTSQTFQRDAIERILGPVDGIRAPVAASLASTMRQGLSGDWRSREAQKDAGFERSDSEVRKIVEEGYDLATALAAAAVNNSQNDQEAWQHATLKAALTFDRMQFRGEREQDAAAYDAARQLVFRAFGDAAELYRKALAEGRVRASMQIYDVWFSLALGASDLGALTLDDLMTEGLENADQIDRIREDILGMEQEQASYHLGEFARGIVSKLPQANPEVKPRMLQAAARVVGDHPAGAPIRRTLDLYDELVKQEIHLRLEIDGSDQVGTKPFGATLTLQHTASIDQSAGGFARYLMDSYTEFNAGQWTTINYQERLRKSIESSFDGKVELLGIGFFQPMNPAVPIRMNGQTGWQEKPMAYLVLQAVDASVDRLPEIQMDMHFNDASGPIVLPIVSNTVLVDAGTDPVARPLADLVVEQTLDARPMLQGKGDREVTLEVVARGTGVIPEIQDLLTPFNSALDGYSFDSMQILTEPFDVSQAHRHQAEDEQESTTSNRYSYYERSLPNLDPDSDGRFRLGTLRRWTVKFIRQSEVSVSEPSSFEYPEINEVGYQPIRGAFSQVDDIPAVEEIGSESESVNSIGVVRGLSRFQYVDYDLVEVEGNQAIFVTSHVKEWTAGGALLSAILLAGLVYSKRRRKTAGARESVGVITTPELGSATAATLYLTRLQSADGMDWSNSELSELKSDIERLQRLHFSNDVEHLSAGAGQGDGELATVIQRWAARSAVKSSSR